MSVKQQLRRIGKPVIATLIRHLPKPAAGAIRRVAERLAFRLTPAHQAHTLPAIFHYWASRYVQPMLQAHGFDSPEDMYHKELLAAASRAAGRPLRIVSCGSGNGELEIGLAAALAAHDIKFHFACLDLNAALLETARKQAASRGLQDRMSFVIADCNRQGMGQDQDIILVNQFLHHVEQLPGFCEHLARALATDGVLLTSDVVGRNGHLLWPDVRREVERFWQQLRSAQRIDQSSGRVCDVYREVDHAAYSSEGIRAQDIVTELTAKFDFEVFLTHGACIIPFVERRFGWNFDPSQSRDREFIDRVHLRDAELIRQARIPAANMLAVLTHKGKARRRCFDPISPAQHIQLTLAQEEIART